MRKPRKVPKHIKNRLATAKRQDWRWKHMKKQGGRCFYCGVDMQDGGGRNTSVTDVTLDHLVPLSKGGEDHWMNTCACCLKCNQDKGDLTADDWLDAKYAIMLREQALVAAAGGGDL